MKFTGLLLMIVVIRLLTLASSYLHGDHYTAFVFPDSYNIPSAGKVHLYTIGKYDSYDACLDAGIEKANDIGYSDASSPTFQCGFDCYKKDDLGGLMTCKYLGENISLTKYVVDKFVP